VLVGKREVGVSGSSSELAGTLFRASVCFQRPPIIPYRGFSPARLEGRHFRQRLPENISVCICPSRFPWQQCSLSESAIARQNATIRHSSDPCHSTPGALAPVWVVSSRFINTESAPCAPLADTAPLPSRAVDRFSRPHASSFHCTLLLGMPSSAAPEIHRLPAPSLSAVALAFTVMGMARQNSTPHTSLHVGVAFRGLGGIHSTGAKAGVASCIAGVIRMARKTGDLTLRLDRVTRVKLDKIAEKRLGRKRSTGTFLKMLAVAAIEREERSSELRQMLRSLPADPEAANENERRRREDPRT